MSQTAGKKRNVPNCRIRSKTTPQVEDGQRMGRIWGKVT